ncbi:isochorismatase [Tenacibaculum sp. KUL152]|nr:isochorismatase [Tenacibaculum sp. KUL152]
MTIFTPENSVMVLIDHQIGTMQLVKNLPLEDVKRFSLALAKAAKILEIPVVMTSSQEQNVQGGLLPELAEILPQAYQNRIQRDGIVNAWNDPAFKAAIEATGRKHLIMAGITTDVCLVFPSIDAVLAGYEVQAVMDASGSPFDLSESLSQQRMTKAGVTLTTTNTLIAELAQDWSTAHGQQLIQLLFTDVLPTISKA